MKEKINYKFYLNYTVQGHNSSGYQYLRTFMLFGAITFALEDGSNRFICLNSSHEESA